MTLRRNTPKDHARKAEEMTAGTERRLASLESRQAQAREAIKTLRDGASDPFFVELVDDLNSLIEDYDAEFENVWKWLRALQKRILAIEEVLVGSGDAKWSDGEPEHADA